MAGNFIPTKFLADNELRKPRIQQLYRKLTYFVVEALSKLFTTYDQFTVTETANRSSQLAPSLWHGSFLPTATYVHTLILSMIIIMCSIISPLKYTLSSCRVTVSMWEFVGGVVRRDLVAKIKITQKFFPSVFVGDSRKFMLAKISHYVVHHVFKTQ